MNSVRLLIPIFAAVLATAGCSKHEPTATVLPDLPPAQVSVATVRAQEVPAMSEVTGSVRPVQRATIAAKVMGTIAELPVTLGQPIKEGDVLLRIAAAEISARLLQAQAQLNQAQRDLTRERTLLAQNASTSDMVKGLEDRVAMTEAMVNEAEVMLGYTTITAPFDGVVARKLADAGDLAAPGMPLLEVEGTTAFEIDTNLPDSLAARLKPGARLNVEIPAANLRFTAELTELSPAADAQARTVPAKLAVPADAGARSGQFVRVQVPGAPVQVLLVPSTAVKRQGQMELVFVAHAGRAELRIVKTGALRGDAVEILSGLADSESVIVNPPAGLREGQPLEVTP
jgi:RND family efflux transporter MFP subunit